MDHNLANTTSELECIDRMYLNVYVPMLQTGTGTSYFFRKIRGNPVPSSALMEPMTRRFVGALATTMYSGVSANTRARNGGSYATATTASRMPARK